MERGTEYIFKLLGVGFILGSWFLMGSPQAKIMPFIGFFLYLYGWFLSVSNDNKTKTK